MRLRFTGVRLLLLPMLLSAASCSSGSNAAPPAPATAPRGISPQSRTARGVDAGAITAFFADPTNTRQLDATIKGQTKAFYIKGADYGLTQIGDYPDPNPLDNTNSTIWAPNLRAMRDTGVNAVKVYNVTLTDFVLEKPKPGQSGKIDAFLNAAWNNGNQPVFVVLSIFFGGDLVLDSVKLAALKAEYHDMTKTYSAFPAVMGVSLGSEINSETLIDKPQWWRALNEVSKSITDGYREANAKKIVTTTMVDDGLNTVVAKEANGFKIDAWGVDSYRGHTFTNIWQQVTADTTKPFIMAEYGAPASSYRTSSVRYDPQTFACAGYPPNLPSPDDVGELPRAGNPRMQFLETYVKDNATELGANAVTKGGVGSGGFYFEWNDEWWKSGYPKAHVGGAPHPGKIIVNKNAVFPGCYQDEAWFGLNSLAPGSPNRQIPRPTLNVIKQVWASQ